MSAFGYHSLAQGSYKRHPLYAGNKEQFLEAFTARGRADEIAILKRLEPHLRVAAGKMWLLSLVMKEDLWFKESETVRQFYNTGEYQSAVDTLASARGAAGFRHEFLTISLVINNFVSGDGEMLRMNTAGYDHRRQVESMRQLFEALNAVMEWEGRDE